MTMTIKDETPAGFRSTVANYTDLSRLNASHHGTVTCPFHNDRTPSLSVDLKKGFFYCFGCGVKGRGRAKFLTLVKEHRLRPISGRGGGGSIPLETSATLQPAGCTLKDYAKVKRLPAKFLRRLGLDT